MNRKEKKRALILMSQTGGGHRSVAKAIERGLLSIGGGEVQPSVVDLFASGRSSFLDRLVHLYAPVILHSPTLWSLVYHAANDRRRFAALAAAAWPFLHRKLEGLLSKYSPDVVVSVHPLSNHILTRAVSELKLGVPVVTVLTDLVDVHAGWANVDSDLCFAPTSVAAKSLVAKGVRPERVLTLGLPIGPRFGAVEEEAAEVRASLGLSPDKFTILVVGGSEGAGGILRVVEAVSKSDLGAQLIVVCGRNESLRRAIEKRRAVRSGRVFGFVENMPELMHAADVVATKAGSLSIAEALASRRPIILFRALPGQEQGNVGFVRENGVGFASSDPVQIVKLLQLLAGEHGVRQRLAANTAKVRRPEAALEVSKAIARLVGVTEGEKVRAR